MRCILIVGDGMADRPLKELNYLTPLEAAKPHNMDRLAANGVSGLLDPIAPGIAPSSDVANLAILGYDPMVVCGGRGPFEAAGAGLRIEPGDLAFRCNFATVNDRLGLVDERAGRIGDEARDLGAVVENIRLKVNSDIKVEFKQTLGFKGALVLKGEKISPKVTSSLPNVGDRVGYVKALDGSFDAKRTADAVNEFVKLSFEKLDGHPINVKRKSDGKAPANVVIPWSGGKLPNMPLFEEKYELRAACVAAASLIKGIAKLSGMSVLDVAGATGDLDTDTIAKAKAALGALECNDFVFVHVEGPDEASHDGNVQGKIGIIQKIDAMVGEILSKVDLEEVAIVMLADHATSTKSRQHTGDPVPFTIASAEVVKDGVVNYSERAAYKGGLNRVLGKNVMPLILNLMGCPEKISRC